MSPMMPPGAPQGAPPPGPGGPPQGGPPDIGAMLTKIPEVMGKILSSVGDKLPPEAMKMFEQSAQLWQQGVEIAMGGGQEAPQKDMNGLKIG